ncbi:MAG TPA: class I SAM-dependent methyltransferase [Christensenellaceae bacterium]|jgi:SAM-dependent methyltransferase|nr:class I SAM-dependent methyltransferase [Christensenellaceae bacterium]
MDKEKLYREWKNEEKIAHIKGWDFSHISDRYVEEDELPWDFKSIIDNSITDEMNLLDMETGGGEFLLELNHPYSKTSAIEGYKPNVEFCKDKLLPLGIDFKEADGAGVLLFGDSQFDIVTNRHGDYTCSELKRILKTNGLFLTQQVGAENDWELIKLLQPEIKEMAYPNQYLAIRQKELEENGFDILESGEAFRPIKFFDVGALVWFAKIIEWEFINFEVDKYLDNLYKAKEILERDGAIQGRIHRFYMVARKQ